ncbi:MAG: biotin carboxylase N-terminal domain-containing protein [Acidobacteriota bacterium]|nr:biotin carboxylase N-terminal domain-containing protein [Acidobacteriota bacterium]
MTSARRLSRVLVANRGEIAVRVIRACRTAGLECVAVYSDADREARHVALADAAVRLGPAPAKESYLSIPLLISAAQKTRCDAVHPGYGFLSENADFARAVVGAGLVWIGPPAEAMEAMGSKISARERMRATGVPVVPGALIPPETSGSFKEISSLGFPVVVKASAGGGGKGMRVVGSEAELSSAISSCRREALSAFGDSTVYVEKYLDSPRHIEVQVLGDMHGNVVALGERECSLQRRHQKVVEECPSPAVTPELRSRLCQAAVEAARAVGYVSAGTVEFLLEPSGAFWFLEMNTRLQVEHPVTEEAFSVDLVALQLSIAAGERLPELPAAPSFHAIEARVYAEDPDAGFLPQAGRLLLWVEPSGPGVRVDSGVTAGQAVDVHYDPMLAKIVGVGRTREEARRRLVAALRETVALGVTTNLSWLGRLLESDPVVRGETNTGLLETLVLPALLAPPDEVFAAAAAVLSGPAAAASGGTKSFRPGPFDAPFRIGSGA